MMVKDFFESPATTMNGQQDKQDQQKEYINKAKAKVKGLYFESPVEAQYYDFKDNMHKAFCGEEEEIKGLVRDANDGTRRGRYSAWFDIYKKDFRCVICKNDDTEVLDFHHLDRKIKNHSISSMIGGCMRLQDIQAELKKCIAVCLHCHRKIENGSISEDEVMEKAHEEYYVIEKPRPGEDILEDFPALMLQEIEYIFITSKYDDAYIRRYRIYYNFEDSEGLHLERHPDYVNFCKKRIESKDPNVDIELDRPDVLGEFDRGFSDIDLY